MLIAASVVAGLLASAAVSPVNPSTPRIVVNVSAAPNVPSSVVAQALAEVDAIFRITGFACVWRRDNTPFATLQVVLGNDTGLTRGTSTPLGWIRFDDGRPDESIYVSYANAERYLEESRLITGSPLNMTVFERELLLGRATGRALAHELGHYLLATKTHTKKGLLKAARSAQEFFAPDRSAFAVETAQRIQIVSRLLRVPVIASR